MKITLTTIFSLVVMSIQQTFGGPAYPYTITYKQPDGSSITITLKGDEHIKWAESEDGYTLLRDKKGYFEYASQDDDRKLLIPSGRIARDINKRSTDDITFLSGINKGLMYSQSQISTLKRISSFQNDSTTRSFPTTGQRKLVCILIGFADVDFTKSKEDFENLFNQVGYSTEDATGSVRDYYLENSYGQLDLEVTVAGPYKASHNMAYYGTNDSDDNDNDPRALVEEAVNLADKDVNFADFDNDKNGSVDGVYVIYAGYGEEAGASADAIWAHAWNITPITLDGTIVSKYSCSAELSGNSGTSICTIGVICHEFGHVLGAPDYYDTDYELSGGNFKGTGNWDIMAGGSWNNDGKTPAHHNVYTKVYIYHWAQATELTTTQSIEVNPTETSNASFYKLTTSSSGDYFLMENRQQTGFDSAIPGHGMIIYHVHPNLINGISDNSINNGTTQEMYPVCASATTDPGTTLASYGTINSAGCPFPGSINKREFSDATIPSSKSWTRLSTGKPITNIKESYTTKVVTFDISMATTGIEETEGIALTTSFPNPFSTYITVNAKSPIKSVIVYDITGKTILNIPVNLENSKIINTENFARGYYFIKVTDSNNHVSTIKTVKQ